MSGALDGRCAVITGAGGGLGRAFALGFAREGARVVAADLDGDAARATCATVVREVAGAEAVPVTVDVSVETSATEMARAAVEEFGTVDVLVNNAAVTFLAPVEQFSDKRFRLMVELQVWAPYHLTQLVLPSMYERGAGWVLNISSRVAVHPVGPPFEEIQTRGFSVYGMCKAALERFTTALAAEGHPHGVRANALAPFDNVATPGAGAHDLVTDFALEDESVMAEAALALVEGDLTGRIALSQLLLAELGRARAFPAVSERAGGDG